MVRGDGGQPPGALQEGAWWWQSPSHCPAPPPSNHFPSKHPQNVLFSTQTLHFLPDHPQTPPLSTQTHRPPPHPPTSPPSRTATASWTPTPNCSASWPPSKLPSRRPHIAPHPTGPWGPTLTPQHRPALPAQRSMTGAAKRPTGTGLLPEPAHGTGARARVPTWCGSALRHRCFTPCHPGWVLCHPGLVLCYPD